MFVGLTSAAHRGYYFSHYDDDDWNQAGFFCWKPYPYVHCDGTLFGDVTDPLGASAYGFAEILVR